MLVNCVIELVPGDSLRGDSLILLVKLYLRNSGQNFLCSRDLSSQRQGNFAREVCDDVEKLFFCSRLVCWKAAPSPELRVRGRRQRFALGVVTREQNEVTFEVTGTSFRFAMCKTYDEV
jgi:hypothetical protein